MDEEEYNKIFNYINDGSYSKDDLDDNEKRRIRKRSQNFEILDGKLYYNGGKCNKGEKANKEEKKLVITADQKVSILNLCHAENGSHLGMEKTYYKLSERYYWKGMSTDVKHYVKHCENCQCTNKKTKTAHTELKSVKIPNSTWKKIAIDLIGPYNDSKGEPLSAKGYRYVLTVIDYFSNYVEAFPLKRKLASEVAERMYELFCRHGMPIELVSDNGGEFNSLLTSSLEAQYGYKHITITPYHPQSNGRSERFNQTLKSMISKTVNENTDSWERYVPQCCFAYNTSKQNSTKFSPYFLMYWRNPVLPNENMHGETVNTFDKFKELSETEIEKAGNDMLQIQKQIADDVVENVDNAQKKQKINFDKRHNVVANEFKKGDKVLVKNLKRKKTLGMRRWLGPYTVSDIPRAGTYSLVDKDKVIGKYRQNNIKKYYEPEDEVDETTNEKETIDENNNDTNDEDDGHSIFITQSNFTNPSDLNEVNDNSNAFDLDIQQLLTCPSPCVLDSADEATCSTRPKRQCVGKDRRNSIYEYFPILSNK